jgi:MFS transporter, DHA1 family, multidrug resistance protein
LVSGLVLAVVSAALLLAMALAEWMPLPLVVFLLILGTLAFGLVAPNALHEAMQPLPQIAGAAGAASGCIQMAVGAVSSGLVAILYDGHSALSMTFVMLLRSLLAVVSYVMVARAAEPAVSLS